MTTLREPKILLVSSTTSQDLWSHPTLDLFQVPIEEVRPQKALLFTTPSTFGESFDDDDRPMPTSSSQLPDIHQWTMAFATNFLEILAGRRQPGQLATRCHRVTYNSLLSQAGRLKEIGRIRKIHQDFPLDGLCESTITVRFGERVRALVIRTEGINGQWLCTAARLI
ncbi:hypothetical protein MCEMRE196_01079 [Candidatus Nanopelagicaceae bacterium]